MEIATQRLVLRQWKDEDYAPFAALNADPRVMEFFPTLLDRETSNAMADRCRSLIDERGWGLWAVEVRETGRFIGFVGLHVPAAKLPFAPCVEIAWRLEFSAWGHGFATKAARAALEFGFGELWLDEIVAFTFVGNRRSRAVMERLDMVESSEFLHPDLPLGSPLRQHVLYRLARVRWSGLEA
jgi:RimJ/RimL family protein N-acetyltransferase